MNDTMTAKGYLGRAYYLDRDIQAKLLRAQSYREMATRTTPGVSDMPRSSSPDQQRMASLMAKTVDLENEMNADIDRLLELKSEIGNAIEQIGNHEYRLLLELRYLYFQDWRQIAASLHYSVRWAHTIHLRALDVVDELLQVHPASEILS